jgi:CelD/BcsL family acetyltransferase involved in cellulose biosynthesis
VYFNEKSEQAKIKLKTMNKTSTEIIAAVKNESFDSFFSYWNNSSCDIQFTHIFLLPHWLKEWWEVFGDEYEQNMLSVWENNKLAGIAPLKVNNKTVSFIGSPDVCDYLDFLVSPGREDFFFNTVLNYLIDNGINEMDLRCLRPDSNSLKMLMPIAEQKGCSVICEPEDISLEIDLPLTWDEYLNQLNQKQRHEVKRKFRRLGEAGEIRFQIFDNIDGNSDLIELFFDLFKKSRTDKTEFMTNKMESFFKAMIFTMAKLNILKIGILFLNNKPAASVLYFDYNNSFYLYNNGYDPDFNSLSVGVLSKAFCIQKAIDFKRKKFDFLKGQEIYKYRLGGKEVPLTKCRIMIK